MMSPVCTTVLTTGWKHSHRMIQMISIATMTLVKIMRCHMKHQIMGREAVGAVTNGKLDFGPWEQIFYREFGGRRKRVLVKIIGE